MASGIAGFARPTYPMSQRSVMNMDYVLNGVEYIFIDHLLLGCSFGGQGSGIQANGFASTTFLNSSLFDATTGYPKVNPPTGSDSYSIGYVVPIPANYPGPYIIDGTGEGQFSIFTNSSIVCTTDASGTGGASGLAKAGTTSNVTVNTSNTFTISSDSGAGWTVRVSAISSTDTAPILCGFKIVQTNQNANGNFLGKFGRIRLYREGDKARLLAGKLTRLPHAQHIADLNPSAIRFMNPIGGNGSYNAYDDHTCRFEQRQLPTSTGLINNNASPPYTSATSAGHSTYTLASATGMPAAMTHGEVVFCRTDTASYPAAGGYVSPQLVTLANPGVATHVAHGYSTGDFILWAVPVRDNLGNGTAYGMTGLDRCFAAITVIDADHYSIGLDTTLASVKHTVTFSGAVITETGSNRNAGDPVVFTSTGTLPTGLTAGVQYYVIATGLTANQYEVSATAGGTAITTSGGSGTHSAQTGWFGNSGNTSVNNCTAIRCPSLNVGARGAFPVVEPDGVTSFTQFDSVASGGYYTFCFDKNVGFRSSVNGAFNPGAWLISDSFNGISQFYAGMPIEYAVQIVNEVNELYTTQGRTDLWLTMPARGMLSMDPDYSEASNWAIGAASVVYNGANGFPALTNNALCWWQFANETWNPTNITIFLARASYCRYNDTKFISDIYTYSALRSCVMVKDLRRAFPNNHRMKFVLGIQGFGGVAGSNFTTDGNATITADVVNTWQVAPMVLHDAMAGAPYIEPGDGTWDAANLDTNVTLWKGGTPAQKAAARAAYLVGWSTPTVYPAQTTAAYTVLADAYAAKMATYGPNKYYIHYEGYWNRRVFPVGSANYNGNLTQDQSDFLVDCKRNTEWRDIWIAFMDHHSIGANKAMPGFFTPLGSLWGFAIPNADVYDASHVEYGAFDATWIGMGVRNQKLP